MAEEARKEAEAAVLTDDVAPLLRVLSDLCSIDIVAIHPQDYGDTRNLKILARCPQSSVSRLLQVAEQLKRVEASEKTSLRVDISKSYLLVQHQFGFLWRFIFDYQIAGASALFAEVAKQVAAPVVATLEPSSTIPLYGSNVVRMRINQGKDKPFVREVSVKGAGENPWR